MILWLPLSVPAHKSFYIYIRCLNGVGQTRLFGIDSLSAQIILHLLYIRCWTKSYFHLFGIDLLHTALDWLHRWLQRRLYFNKLVELTTVYQVLLPRQLHPFHQVRNGSSTSCFSKAPFRELATLYHHFLILKVPCLRVGRAWRSVKLLPQQKH